MTAHRSRRWFQLSLKSLFLLTLLVATFLAGYTLAMRQAEAERRQAEMEAQRALEESRLQAEAQAIQAQLAQMQAWPSVGATWNLWPQQPPPQLWPLQPQVQQPQQWPQLQQQWIIGPQAKQ